MKLRKKAAAVTVAAALSAALVPAAHAADDTNVTVNGGSLSITNPAVGNFAPVTLDGSAKGTTATMDNFSATDARGTGDGWNVTVQATQFKEHNGTSYVDLGKQLPQNSLQMAAPNVAKSDQTSSAEPQITTGPYTIDAAAAVKIASAGSGGPGMGSYNFSNPSNSLALSIPASTFAKTYRSDVTVSIVSGP